MLLINYLINYVFIKTLKQIYVASGNFKEQFSASHFCCFCSQPPSFLQSLNRCCSLLRTLMCPLYLVSLTEMLCRAMCFFPLCKTVNKRRTNGPEQSWTMDNRTKRFKGHFARDPCGQLVAMLSVLPPPQQLVSSVQVTSICSIVKSHTACSQSMQDMWITYQENYI